MVLAQPLEILVHLGNPLTMTLARRLLGPLMLVLGHVSFATLLCLCSGVCCIVLFLPLLLHGVRCYNVVIRFTTLSGFIGFSGMDLLLALLFALFLDSWANAALERKLSTSEHP